MAENTENKLEELVGEAKEARQTNEEIATILENSRALARDVWKRLKECIKSPH